MDTGDEDWIDIPVPSLAGKFYPRSVLMFFRVRAQPSCVFPVNRVHVKRMAPFPPVSSKERLEADRSILEFRSEILEEIDATKQSYGDFGGGYLELAEVRGGDDEVARTPIVQR